MDGPNEGRWVRRVPAVPEGAVDQPAGGQPGVEGHFAFHHAGQGDADADRPRNAQGLQCGDEGEPEEGEPEGGR